MTLELDFGGTTSREVRALLVVKKEEEQVYEQEVVIRSMYDYEIEGDDVVGLSLIHICGRRQVQG